MSEPFLILHKVRGAPAFDIAEQMIVEGYDEPWWIIPTSGHRAYPWWWVEINDVPDIQCLLDSTPSGLPDNWPDHYQASEARSRLATAAGDLLSLIGLGKAKPQEPVKRRVIP
jgi:hypothetical protein